MSILLAILIWVVYIILDAGINWYIIVKKKTSPDHLLFTIIRGILAILWGAYCVDVVPDKFVPWLGFTVGSFWILFDISLNLMRGLSPFYIGDTSDVDKWGDQEKQAYWVLKILLGIGAVISAIYL